MLRVTSRVYKALSRCVAVCNLLDKFYFNIFQVWDATSADPKLLVFLKSYRNTVPVPRHWSQKRKYLQVCDISSNGTVVNT